MNVYTELCSAIMQRVYSDMEPVEMHQWLSDQVAKLSVTKDESARLPWLDSFEVYNQLLDKRLAMSKLPPEERKILTWPWKTWNNLIDPMEPGLLAVLAGGDGVGKTIYAEVISEYWAKTGHNVVLAHFELNRAIMLDRRAARQTGIQRRRLKSGDFNPQELNKLADMNDRLPGWKGGITYLHTPSWTMDQLTDEARKLNSEGLCDVLVIDYLEKSGWSSNQLKMYRGSSFQQEANNVEIIKNFSEQTEIPTLMLAQMNKSGKTKDFGDLNRTDMRGAGEKSEKANIVILLHRESSESSVINVRIDKNTLGATGTFKQFISGADFMVGDLQQ